MDQTILVLVLNALAVYGLSPSINIDIAPVNKEVIYNYHAQIQTGTESPDHHVSEYQIKAKLHIQGIVNTEIISAQLTDTTTTMFNGKLSNRDQSIYQPTKTPEINLPFLISFDPTGQIMEMDFDENDQEWSIRLKKGITTLFQIYRNISSSAQRFRIKEMGVNGPCEWFYNINDDMGNVEVMKLLDPMSCERNHDMEDNVMSIAGERRYNLDKVNDSLVIKEINSFGQGLLYPQQVQNEIFTSSVRQKLDLELVNEVKTPVYVNMKFLQKFTQKSYNMDIPTQCGELDFTYRNETIDSILEIIDSSLKELILHMDRHHLVAKQPDVNDSKLINNILDHLQHCDFETLQQIEASLYNNGTPEKSTQGSRKYSLFLQLLPHVGTHHAIILIRDLLPGSKISDTLRVRMLNSMVVECPTEELITKISDMITIPKPDSLLYNTSILAFGTILKHTFEALGNKKSEVLEKYVELYVTRFQEAEDLGTKGLYLQGLCNIQHGSVFEHLEPIVLSEIDDRLKTLALTAMFPALENDLNRLMRICLPILSNRKLSTEVRITAYVIYVKVNNPSVAHFMNLYWLMTSETDEYLYTFHYNTIKALSTDTNLQWPNVFEYYNFGKRNLGFHLTTAENAKLIYRMSRPPMIAKPWHGTFIREFDGITAQAMLMNTENVLNGFLKLQAKVNGNHAEMMTVMIRILDKPKHWMELSDLLHKKMDLVVKQHGRVTLLLMDQQFNLETLAKIAMSLDVLGENDRIQDAWFENHIIMSPFGSKKVFVNDIGMPLQFLNRLTILHSFKLRVDSGVVNMNLKRFEKAGWVVQTFNPISQAWHGIQSTDTLVVSLPLKIAGNFSRRGFEFRMMKVSMDDGIDAIGMRHHGMVHTFVMQMENLLRQYCMTCSTPMLVTRGSEFKKTIPLFAKDLSDIGKRIELQLFDCDADMSRGTIISLLHNTENRQKYETPDLIALIMKYQRLLINFRNGHMGSCGMLYQILPIDNFDQFQLNVEQTNPDANTTGLAFISKIQSNQSAEISKHIGFVTIEKGDRSKPIELNFQVANKEQVLKFYLKGVLNDMNVDFNMLLEGGVNGKLRVDVKGMMSPEQKMIKPDGLNHNNCARKVDAWSENVSSISLDCVAAMTILRKYVVGIETPDKNHPLIKNIYRYISSLLVSYVEYTTSESAYPEIGNQMNMTVLFPLNRPEVDIQLEALHGLTEFEGIPTVSFDVEAFGLTRMLKVMYPVNFFYGFLHHGLDVMMAAKRICVIKPDTMMTENFRTTYNQLTGDWVEYLQIGSITIWVKKQRQDMVMKITAGSNKFEEFLLDSEVINSDNRVEEIGTAYSVEIKVNEKIVNETLMEVDGYRIYKPWARMMVLSTRSEALNIIQGEGGITISYARHYRENATGKCVIT